MTKITFDEASAATVSNDDPGLEVTNQDAGGKERGTGLTGRGSTGVVGFGNVGVEGDSFGPAGIGVLGHGTRAVVGYGGEVGIEGSGVSSGVHGISSPQAFGNAEPSGNGVLGDSAAGTGVAGVSTWGTGMTGTSQHGRGVTGHSEELDGVMGTSANGTGVFGEGTHAGVHGKSGEGHAVFAEHTSDGDGVHGLSASGTGVAGLSETGSGVFGRSSSGRAGYFDGSVKVTGDLQCDKDLEVTGDIRLVGADCAEEFFVTEDVVPGTVMVIDDDGALAISTRAYDTRVAGVVAGAGSLRPGVVLDTLKQGQGGRRGRRAISLLGKTFCCVDATELPVAVGDLLTSADLPGHAMRVSDRGRASGAVLGKALAPLHGGVGLLPILIALQ